MKITFLNNNLMSFEGIIIDETGFYKKSKLYKLELRGKVKIIEFTEEGIKGISKYDFILENIKKNY